jgi:tRNA pseudouridine32 synthase/23S rRNA pseudouridine746 synthase
MVTVLHEDDDVLAVDKPAGVVVIPARDEPPGESLRHRLEAARGERLWVVHRIDRDTTGVVLFARRAESHRLLSLAFEQRRAEKTYLALTRGVPAEGVIDVALHPARKGKMRPALPGERDALEASTACRVLRAWRRAEGSFALVEAHPRTGRQHQVRVHLRAVEAPLLVDPLYGRAESATVAGASLTRLTLHAHALAVPLGDRVIRVESPLAGDLRAAVEALDASP